MSKHRDTMPANPKPNGVREPPGVASHTEPRGVPSHVRAPAGFSASAQLVLELVPHDVPHVRVMLGLGS